MKKVYKPTAPCKDCPDRILGCHSTCMKYIKFKKQMTEWNKQERYISQANDMYVKKPLDPHGRRSDHDSHNSIVARVYRKNYYKND